MSPHVQQEPELEELSSWDRQQLWQKAQPGGISFPSSNSAQADQLEREPLPARACGCRPSEWVGGTKPTLGPVATILDGCTEHLAGSLILPCPHPPNTHSHTQFSLPACQESSSCYQTQTRECHQYCQQSAKHLPQPRTELEPLLEPLVTVTGEQRLHALGQSIT